MTSIRKQKRQELRQPDQFVTFWGQTGEWIGQRRKALLSLFITIIVVVFGIETVRGRNTAARADESRAFVRIAQIADAPLMPEKPEGETAAATPAPVFTDGLPHFKTDAERKKAALDESEKFLNSYPKTPLRQVMELMQARYRSQAGLHEPALKTFERLAGASDLPDDLGVIAQEGLALEYEAAGKMDEAIATLDKLVKRSAELGDFYRDRALFNKGRLLQARGDVKEAVAVYREIADKYPDSSLREEVSDRIAVLESSGAVAKPAPAAEAPAPAAAPKAPAAEAPGPAAAPKAPAAAPAPEGQPENP